MSGLIKKCVRALSPYVPGEQPDDPDVLKLNTNENPYPPSPAVQAVLSDYAADRLSLYPDPVCTTLRTALADLHGCSIENTMVGNGSDEVLALCMRAFVEEGGSVGFFDPSYSVYPVLADIQGTPTHPVELPDDFSWVSPETTKDDLFFLTHPNAPTSLLFPKEAITSFCEAFSGVVVIDEAYVDFSAWNCSDLAWRFPNVIIVRTLSKSHSLAGIRLGYALGSAELMGALIKIKDSYNVNALTQAVATAAVNDSGHMQANVERIKKTRTRVTHALKKRGYDVADSETNFLWVRPGSITAQELFESLKKEKVLIRHFASKRLAAYVRITLGTDEQMDRLLDVMDAVG